jgi:hypothetical protein
MQACGFQIIQALRMMNLVDRLGHLQLDEAQPMIRLDRRLTLSSPVSICVFCVFCGSILLVYWQQNLSNSLTQAESRDRPIVAEAEGAGRHHGFPFKGRVFSTVIGWRIGFGCALRGRGLARALHHGALCGLGIVLLQGLAGSCEVALMVLREDRVKAAKAASLNRTRSPNKRRPAKARCQTPAG